MDKNYRIKKIITNYVLKFRKLWVVLIAASVVVFFWIKLLPSPLFNDPFSAVLLSSEGKLLGAKISQDQQWRFPPVQSLAEKYKKALLCYEDKRFYWHFGIDPFALGRAIYLNYKHKRIISGGSTLSMQVIRLFRKNPRRTYIEKFIEMFLAVRLECRYTKEQILNLHASHAPFGGNVVGIEAASWRYFGRAPELLSWSENCLLAVLPKNPSSINIGKNRKELKKRRDKLLKKLNRKGLIDDLETKLAMKEPLPGKPYPLPRLAPHLLETLLMKNKYSAKFESTIEYIKQESIKSIMIRHSNKLKLKGIRNIAAIVIDNGTLEVKAYFGNSVFNNLKDSGYAIDLIHRPRSTGSILKPLLYSAMLQYGDILPTTLVPDIPTQYGNFKPQNYDQKYRGAVPAKTALARSLNVPAVRMLKRYGVGRFYDFLRNIGVSTLHRKPDEYGLTLILGGAEATLWDLAGIYANLAHMAKGNGNIKGSILKSLKLLEDEVQDEKTTTDIGPASAWLTIKALVDVTRPEQDSYWENFHSSQKIAWKTGTSYGHRDAWAIGSDAHYTVAVWAGNANSEQRPEIVGVLAAAPVMFDIFDYLDSNEWFDIPYDFLKEVIVCKNDGYLPFGDCETEVQFAPKESNFDLVSPHNKLIHLDSSGKWRVHGKAEAISNMIHKTWFVLSPSQEYYYMQYNSDYKMLPAYRDDCKTAVQFKQDEMPMQFLYPNIGARIYLPIDLAEQKGRTIFEVVHRDPNAVVFWHLDGDYLGKTETFHQWALDINPGKHEVTLVDQLGNYLSRNFEILGK
ncbi:penicillin-binding protein 1C [bacterium]